MKEEIFKEIISEMMLNGTYGEEFKFQCFACNILSYTFEEELHFTEINIIADDVFFKSEKPEDIFNKKRIKFLEHSMYYGKEGHREKIGSRVYRPIAELGQN